MSFTTYDDTKIQLSNCEVVCRPVGADYYEGQENLPFVRISTRIQDVKEGDGAICCLFEEFEQRSKDNMVDTNETVESVCEILRARRQVFNWYLRPRGDQGQELTYKNWMNLRKKCTRLVSALNIGGLMSSKPASLPSVEMYEGLSKAKQAAAFKKIVKSTKDDMKEMAGVIQARVNELKGQIGTKFFFSALTSFFGTNYSTRTTQDGEREYMVRYLNLRFIQ